MFKLVDSPTQMPGVSILGDTRGPMVDLGVDVNGWVYLSMVEAEEVARTIGWVAPQDHDNTAALHDASVERVRELEAQLAAVDEARPKVLTLDDVLAYVRSGEADIDLTRVTLGEPVERTVVARGVARMSLTEPEPVARKKPGPKPKQAA